ncbi:MAG: hypothetical protein HQ547_02910 [Candidatus Omnitrophica bacterium]|nr:hypothetical protein [Candidatus Omnitrophota bacterium]
MSLKITKSIVGILVFTFLCQGIVWAHPYSLYSLRAKAFRDRGGNNNGVSKEVLEAASSRLTQIQGMKERDFSRLSPDQQDEIFLFLHQVHEEIPELDEFAEKEIDRFFSTRRLNRMIDKYVGKKRRWIARKAVRFYAENKDFREDRRRAGRIAKTLLGAPHVKAVYGVGYPFYGDADITKIIFFTILRLARGKIDEVEFLKRIIPDVDLLIVWHKGEYGQVPLGKIRKGMDMSPRLRNAFVVEMHYIGDQWAEIFRDLGAHEGVADRNADPVQEFAQHDRLFVDMVPYPKYVWGAMPVFVKRGDTEHFRWIRDLFFTCEPLAGEVDETALLYRRNVLLYALTNPMREEEVLEKLFAVQEHRLHLRMFSQTKDIVGERFRQAINRAIYDGLIKEDQNGRLSRTRLGERLLREILKIRGSLLDGDIPPSAYEGKRPLYDDNELLLRLNRERSRATLLKLTDSQI